MGTVSTAAVLLLPSRTWLMPIDATKPQPSASASSIKDLGRITPPRHEVKGRNFYILNSCTSAIEFLFDPVGVSTQLNSGRKSPCRSAQSLFDVAYSDDIGIVQLAPCRILRRRRQNRFNLKAYMARFFRNRSSSLALLEQHSRPSEVGD
jgi:hypothetical protein